MAKATGLGDNGYVGGYDLSSDIRDIAINGGPNALEVTAINKSAKERLGGERDGKIEFTTFFDTAVLLEHVALSPLPTADVVVTYCHGTTLGNDAACVVAKQVNYDGDRATDGQFTFKVSALANSFGVEWGKQATAGVRSDTTGTSGTSIDLGTAVAAAGFGLQAYLQVFSVTGTSCTVKLQGSSDNAVGDPFADITGGGFTAATPGGSPQAQRIATATNLTIERYLRVVTTGTFTQCSFAVVVVPNLFVPVF